LLAASRDSFFGFLNLILVSGTCGASLRDQQGRLIDQIVRVGAELLRVADRVWLGHFSVLPTGGSAIGLSVTGAWNQLLASDLTSLR
jgi:hypothetical protein